MSGHGEGEALVRRMQARKQFVDITGDRLPIGQPIARKAERDIGIVDAAFEQTNARIGDALA